jgi:hypothetical protein
LRNNLQLVRQGNVTIFPGGPGTSVKEWKSFGFTTCFVMLMYKIGQRVSRTPIFIGAEFHINRNGNQNVSIVRSFKMAKKASTLFFFWGTVVLSMLAGTGIKLSSPAAHAPNQLIKQITKNPAHDYHVKWSPDGKMLAFASLRSGEPKIWLIPADGGDATLLETGLFG